MRALVYPSDRYACGHYRLIWPAERLVELGHDVLVERPEDRMLKVTVDVGADRVLDVHLREEVDVVVFQRLTHRWLSQVVSVLRSRGVAVVVDVDDDLSSIHPSNPAFTMLHPRNEGLPTNDGKTHMHSWQHLVTACREATLVTTSTPELLRHYAPHGRGIVLANYVPEHVLDVEHEDSNVIGWPASLHSHPNDPAAVGTALRRLVDEGAEFRVVGDPTRVGRAFGLDADPPGEPVELLDYPAAVARLGVAVAPLADTRFNGCKSWLKPLECAAVGVPWVGSPRAEYRRLHELGCGVLADRPRDWYRALTSLRRDATRRRELGEAGRIVAGSLLLRNHAWRWWEAWSDALVLERDRPGRHRGPGLETVPGTTPVILGTRGHVS